MKRTLNELLTEKSLVCKNENRVGTAYCYRSFKNYIDSHYGIVQMSEINPKWAAGLHSTLKKEGKTNATIKNYFAMLQCTVNYGAYLGCTKGDTKLTRSKSYELNKVKIDKPKTRQNKWLSIEEMDRLWDYWASTDNKSHKRWLGLFFASYLCNGANLADVLRLRYDDEYYTSGKRLLGFFRQKTKNSSGAYVRVPIIDRLRTVIDAIGDGEKKCGLVFGSFLNDISVTDEERVARRVMTVNSFTSKVVRTISGSLGMRDDVCVTFARHSYASNLNHQGCNYALIERNLGHILGGVADNYIANAPIEQLFEMNGKLF